MGAACCCLRDDCEDFANLNSSIYRNCICLRCFVQNFVHMVCCDILPVKLIPRGFLKTIVYYAFSLPFLYIHRSLMLVYVGLHCACRDVVCIITLLSLGS